jgi:hypothetical protein
MTTDPQGLTWPVPYDDHARLEYLLKWIPPPVCQDLANASIRTVLHREALVRSLSAGLLSRLVTYLHENNAQTEVHGATPFPSLCAVVSALENILPMLQALRNLPQDERRVHRQLRLLLKELDSALGHFCRLRVYRIDAAAGCYRGLASYGMEPVRYVQRFDAGNGVRFDATASLPGSAAPYESIAGTSCHLLKASAIKTLDPSVQRWYESVLGFGPSITESYTWEFTSDGVAEKPFPEERLQPERFVGALSIDAGGVASLSQRPNGITNLRLHPLAIEWLDEVLCSSIGMALAGGISGLVGFLGESNISQRVTQRSSANGVPTLLSPRIKVIPVSPPKNSNQELNQNQEFAWVFAEGDPACEEINKLHDHYRTSDTWLGFIGPTGTGKELLARALHENGHRRDRKFDSFSAPLLNRDLGRLDLFGAAKGTYTGQVDEREGKLKRLHGGTLLFDEIFKLDAAALGELLNPINTLHDRRVAQSADGATYEANVRVISAGDESQRMDWFDAQWESRLIMPRIAVPSWLQLTEESRVVLVRWMMLRTLQRERLSKGQMSFALYQFLAQYTPRRLAETNMRGLARIGEGLGATCKDGAFRLSPILSTVQGDDYTFACKLINDGLDNQFPDHLRLGEGTEAESRLTAVERTVFNIARCEANETECRCTTEHDGTALGELIESGEDTDLAEALYLVYAATSLRRFTLSSIEKPKDDSKDRLSTGPTRLLKHFRTPGEIKRPFHERIGANLGAMVKQDKGERGTRAAKFQQYIEQPRIASGLFQSVERIACAYPPFLHFVPYWAYWDERTLAQTGNISAKDVFAKSDGTNTEPNAPDEDTNEDD